MTYTSYADVERDLASGWSANGHRIERPGKTRRKVANNTYLERRSADAIALRLHATDVLTYDAEGITYRTGGWQTVTTKERLNRFGPVGIYSTDRVWYVYLMPRDWNAKTPYFEGMRVTYDGHTILNPDDAPDFATVKHERKETEKAIRSYIDLCMGTLAAGMSAPSGGDCWYCAMHTVEDGTSLGDTFHDHEHIRSHMAEGYVVPSLLWNAVAEKGYPIPALILGLSEDGKTMGSTRALYLGGVRNALRAYLRRRLEG